MTEAWNETGLPGEFSLNQLRASQQSVILDYKGGRMGISAVPGSGKTHTLSFLAADILLGGNLDLNQEVLVVTLSNAAADNFTRRIGRLVQSEGLLPGLGYRVRTLHGLAHDIVRERPGLVQLANDFTIIDELEANKILTSAAQAWLRANPDFFDDYLSSTLTPHRRESIIRDELPRLVQGIASNLISYAKDAELTQEQLRKVLDQAPAQLPLAEIGWAIYHEYQRSLAYRGAVDFNDLIRLALLALRSDPALLRRLREQWPYILEDEAQDSSRLQEEILRTLAGDDGNWVRVGDPNQAIYESFTTASPQHLIDFLNSPGVLRKELPVSGRSSPTILGIANRLIDWTRENHPEPRARDALHLPHIAPTDPGDTQQNPDDSSGQVHFHHRRMSSAEEIDVVIASLLRWQAIQDELPEEQRETLAVLDLENKRGNDIANEMRKSGLDPIELLRTTTTTRLAAGTLSHILNYLSDPQSAQRLARAFTVWRRSDRKNEAAQQLVTNAAQLLRKLQRVEDYLYPLPGRDWLESLAIEAGDEPLLQLLVDFRDVARRWHGAALLPVDQTVLTVAQDVFREPAELAIAHRLASALRLISQNNPGWRLPELSEELGSIAKNQRRFLGFAEEEQAFDPKKYRGRIIITTMHKAKGLEWDRVFLLSVNNYDFPSGTPYDSYRSEKWFLRDNLNLEAEALEQLKVALSSDPYHWYEEGRATQETRIDCIRERLRLLYVAITRARRSLIVTWNTGRGSQQPALPFLELLNHWERQTVV